MDRTFQVDLRGIVDLLSHHLYSSPRVYVRELLQNAVDAITARGAVEPGAPATVSVETGPDRLVVRDTGIGLTEPQVHELLATIGRSSKRDEIGFARGEFLGQFGIGLLSAFLVADEVQVVTRPAGGGPTTVWTGYADGRYRVEPAATERDEVGTTVTLAARPGAEQWFAPPTVVELARLFGSLLPYEVSVDGAPITTDGAPWDAVGADRRAALVGYAQDVLGFTPFDVVELRSPEAGLVGAAYVLPFPANPAERVTHRVYLKRMLLAENAEGLLPDWAFFVRCVVDTAELRPTANREALYDDDLLAATREALGDQLRGWLVRLGTTAPRRLADFLAIHHLGVKALALHDDELLRLVDRWLPVETNVGRMTLSEYRDRYGEILYVASTEEFRQLAAVAAAQDLPIVNGGYTYDSELIERLPQLDPGIHVSRLDPTELATRFDTLDPADELALRPFLATAQKALDAVGCEVAVRAFDPASLAAMYLVDRSAAFASELRATRDRADELWSQVLGALDQPTDSRPQLVLNYRSPLVRRLATLAQPHLVTLAVEGLYGQALLLGYHPIRPADAALLNRSFLGLIQQAVPEEEKP
ncbi:HSP90 family protein [Actinomycetes bacterium KLBMP 9797]